jgi:hypothetical protein
MRVYMVTSMVYVNDKLEPITLWQGRIYNVPDSWGKLMLEHEVGAEYRRITQ